MGLGQISLYLMAFVVVSFYLKRWISYRLWRTLHYLSFAVFALGLVHGLMSGTDSAGLPMLHGLLEQRAQRGGPDHLPHPARSRQGSAAAPGGNLVTLVHDGKKDQKFNGRLCFTQPSIEFLEKQWR